MSQPQDTIVAALMEQLIAEGPDGMAQVFTALFNLAMRLERERFLGAGLYERNPDRRGYANGYKSKTLDTTAGTVTVDVPKAAGIDEPFYPQSLERGRRSSRAVMPAIVEMYVQGVSTRDAAKVMAEFGLKSLSSTQVSRADPAGDQTPHQQGPRLPQPRCAAPPRRRRPRRNRRGLGNLRPHLHQLAQPGCLTPQLRKSRQQVAQSFSALRTSPGTNRLLNPDPDSVDCAGKRRSVSVLARQSRPMQVDDPACLNSGTPGKGGLILKFVLVTCFSMAKSV